MLLKCCTQYASKFGKLSSGHRTEKGQFSFQSQRKAMPKNIKTTAQLHSSHTLEKECSKFSKSGFNNMWTMNFWMFKLDLAKAEEAEIKLPTSVGSWKKQDSSRKTSTFALSTMPKPLTVCITINCGKFSKRWEYQTTWSASWEICMQVKKQQLELDIKQRTGSKSGKKYIKAAYCHPAYLMYMQIHHAKCQAGWSTRQNQNCWEKYQ